jgi:HNH endonuclease
MGVQMFVEAGRVDQDVDWETAPMADLEDQLTLFAARIASATAAWLGWLAIFDRRAGYQSWGCRSTAHWLNWKCAMSTTTGHEHVRVARALEALPATRTAFSEGRLSYSKVRAISRVATVESEAELCDLGLGATAAQVEAICAGYRQAKQDCDRSEQEQAADAHEARRVSCRDNHDGTTTITVVLSTVDAKACENAIDTQTDAIIANATSDSMTARDVITERHGIAAVRADAFINLLTDPGAGAESAPAPARIEVLVDINQLTGGGGADPDVSGSADRSTCETGGTRIAPEVAQRLGCDAQISSLIQDEQGNPLSVGRESRVVPRRIRRALNRRDQNRCQFLGCDVTRHLHAHHIVHWAIGGPTELDNLVLVCSFHHHLVHEHGWTIKLNPGGGYNWITPDGETATIKVFRGRHTDLGGHTDPSLIHKLSGDTLHDLSWITTTLIHNESLTRRLS